MLYRCSKSLQVELQDNLLDSRSDLLPVCTWPDSACIIGAGVEGPGMCSAVMSLLYISPLRLHVFSRRILLNYAVFNPTIGYSQGMSDLVAPILAEVLDESDTFWCFVGLMQNTIFISSPRDEDMEKQLVRLSAELFSPFLNFSFPSQIRRIPTIKQLSGLLVPACRITLRGYKIPDG